MQPTCILTRPFKGIGTTAPLVAERLREASLAAFDTLVELCIDRDAAFLVVAGDVYDGPERGLRAQLRFRDGLARLSDAGIASFVVHGNHDPVETGWSALGGHLARARHRLRAGTGAGGARRDRRRPARDGAGRQLRPAQPNGRTWRCGSPTGPGRAYRSAFCTATSEGPRSGYDDYSPCTLEDLRSVGPRLLGTRTHPLRG